MFTCQNPSCKKNFTTPLKTLNLQQNPTEPYFTCPYCLTKIETELIAEEKKEEISLEKALPPKVDNGESEAKPIKNDDKAAVCQHHIGYLSERTGNEQIPDDCLVCKDIVDCMLRKMRD
jgi:hypothetical protein